MSSELFTIVDDGERRLLVGFIRGDLQYATITVHGANRIVARALLKPEAVFEVESGLKLSAFDITAASAVRTEWYQAVRRFFEKYDFLIAPTAQLFAFDADMHWPQEIAGRKMETYHEWMKGVLPITMSGCPALAAPAGFNDQGLPIGIQIVGRNHATH